ncbi:hypothetical protein IF2G_01652 [Cordyceps javanica]|nr:hypothetical protein IF2G_01652 [Cordyceps javanica]
MHSSVLDHFLIDALALELYHVQGKFYTGESVHPLLCYHYNESELESVPSHNHSSAAKHIPSNTII